MTAGGLLIGRLLRARNPAHHLFQARPYLCIVCMESDKRLLRVCQLLLLLCSAARPASADLKALQHVNGEDVVSQVHDYIRSTHDFGCHDSRTRVHCMQYLSIGNNIPLFTAGEAVAVFG